MCAVFAQQDKRIKTAAFLAATSHVDEAIRLQWPGEPMKKAARSAEPTIRVVRCPCCRSLLYSLSTMEPGGVAGWQLTKDSPEVKHDKDGPYMKCPKCSRRVALLKSKPSPGEPPIQVARNQKCDRVLR